MNARKGSADSIHGGHGVHFIIGNIRRALKGSGMPAIPRSSLSGRRDAVYVLLATVLGALLRFYALADQPLWVDEAITGFYFGRADLSWTWKGILFLAGDAPLYPVLMTGWSVVSHSIFWLRSFSAIFGLLGLWPLHRLALAVWGDRLVARTVLFLGACSSFLIYYSQEARAYSLVFFLGAWALHSFAVLVFPRAGESARRRDWAILIVASALLLYTHYFSALLLVAFNVVALTVADDRLSRRAWFLSQAAIGLAFLPWLPQFLEILARSGSYDYIMHSRETLKSIAAPVVVFLLGKNLLPYPGTSWFHFEAVFLATGVVGAAGGWTLGLIMLWKSRGRRVFAGVMLLLVLPVLLAAASALAGVPAYNYTRVKYLIMILPLAIVVVGGSLSAGVRHRRLPLFILGSLFLSNLAGVASYRWNPEQRKDAEVGPAVFAMARKARPPLIAVNAGWAVEALRYHIWADVPDWSPLILDCPQPTETRVRRQQAYDVRGAHPLDVAWNTLSECRPWPPQLWLVYYGDGRLRAGSPERRAKESSVFFESWDRIGYDLGPPQSFRGLVVRLGIRR